LEMTLSTSEQPISPRQSRHLDGYKDLGCHMNLPLFKDNSRICCSTKQYTSHSLFESPHKLQLNSRQQSSQRKAISALQERLCHSRITLHFKIDFAPDIKQVCTRKFNALKQSCVTCHNKSIRLVNRSSKSRPFTATHSAQEDRAIGVSLNLFPNSRTPEAIMVHWLALEFVVQQMNGSACTISRVWPHCSWLDTGLDTGLPFSAQRIHPHCTSRSIHRQ
jgi:hypothetical protein